jgi:hypothetical protein
MVRIKQTWWHIEDAIKPVPGQTFRQVMDIYTNKSSIIIKLNPPFIKLKIRRKDTGQEIPFITDEEGIKLNLNKSSSWPSSGNSPFEKHIKLEIEYTDVGFKPKSKFPFGYKSSFRIDGFTQPEFSITIPRGMKLVSKGNNTKIRMNWIPKVKKHGKKQKKIIKPLKFHDTIYINQEDGKRTYNFLIDSQSYDKIIETPNKYNLSFGIQYRVINQFRFLLIPGIAILLIFLGILEFNNALNSLNIKPINNTGSFTVQLTYIVILISFTTFYLNLLRERYEIPFNNFIMVSIPAVTPFLLFSPQIIMFWENTILPSTISLFIFIYSNTLMAFKVLL